MLDEKNDYLILLIQSGYAALGVGHKGQLLAHKSVRKYMTRKSQGKSQLNYLESKGKSRLGSRIRLRQTNEFFQELTELLVLWNDSYSFETLFLSCSPKLKGAWFQSGSPPPFEKDDPRWEKIPYHVNRPTKDELLRIHALLNRAPDDSSHNDSHYEGTLEHWNDWRQWALCPNPKEVLQEAYDSDGLHALIELLELVGVPQDPTWHPEGDVWIHTLLVVEQMAIIADREGVTEEERVVLMLAALCHDLGKPSTTKEENGRVRSLGHESEGVPITEAFLKRIDCPENIIELVKPLVREHITHASFQKVTSKALRRLEKRLEPATMPLLQLLVEADLSGRPPRPKGLSPQASKIFEAWRKLGSTSL